jgi:peroxiredoxin
MVLEVGVKFPSVTLQDIDGNSVEFPQVLTNAQATVVFFYRGQW